MEKPWIYLGSRGAFIGSGAVCGKPRKDGGSAARLYAPIRIYKQTKGSEKMEEESNRIRKTKIGEKRPSKRKTVSQTMPCDMCGDTQWDEDLNRGETYCLSCGNVVEVNTIDPGLNGQITQMVRTGLELGRPQEILSLTRG